jgi:hypothetical protein
VKSIFALWCALATLFVSGPMQGQQFSRVRSRPMWFVDASVGGDADLGFKQPSRNFGTSVELPLSNRFELDAGVSFSPDNKVVTGNGTQLNGVGSGLFWIKDRFAITGGYEHSTLWTSQFTERVGNPFVGFVVRDNFAHPGRFYLNYFFPTGCVWATASNPCLLQSKRSQGFQFKQEFQLKSYLRFGLGGTIGHSCDQGDPTDPTAGRTCHVDYTMDFHFRLEIPRTHDIDAF